MKTTIRVRFMSIFITLILCPLITIGFVLSIIYQSKVENLVLSEQDIVLKSLNDDVINSQIENKENLIKALSQNEKLYNIFNDNSTLEDVKKLWTSTKIVFPNISWIYYGSNSGELFSVPHWEKPPEYNLIDRPWYITGEGSSSIKWTIPYNEYSNGELILSTTIGIRDKNNNYTGVLSIDTEIKTFFNLLENEIKNKETEVVVVTLNGITLSLKNKDLVLNTTFNWLNFIHHENDSKTITVDGKEYYFKRLFNSKLNLYLVSLIPKGSVNSEIFQVLVVIFILMMFGLISIITAGMLISKDIIDKIVYSQNYIAEIAKGNYAYEISLSDYDEFTILNGNIKKLSDAISSQIEELEVTNKNLDESLTAQGKLVDLRTSLIHLLSHNSASPITFLYNITFNMLEDNRSNKNIKMIHSASRTLKSLNDNIMTLLKLDEGINSNMDEEIDLNELTQMILNNYRLRCEEKDIQFKTNIIGANKIKNNYFIMRMILENLINNAVKYSFSGSYIFIKIWSDNDYGYWEIKDGGPGFTEHDKELLFGKFQTLSAKPTGGEGSIGLGLFLVKELSTHIGVDISLLDNRSIEGASFLIKFDLTR